MKLADSSTFLVRNRTPGEKSQVESTEMVLQYCLRDIGCCHIVAQVNQA